mmetsp:Transcript_25140/g.53368  ORF Transcript_25140/g.53368 Transcript_25140/m.53368 type:complete len:203 (+) Transcript_25140:1264-1872(+)
MAITQMKVGMIMTNSINVLREIGATNTTSERSITGAMNVEDITPKKIDRAEGIVIQKSTKKTTGLDAGIRDRDRDRDLLPPQFHDTHPVQNIHTMTERKHVNHFRGRDLLHDFLHLSVDLEKVATVNGESREVVAVVHLERRTVIISPMWKKPVQLWTNWNGGALKERQRSVDDMPFFRYGKRRCAQKLNMVNTFSTRFHNY